MQTIRWSLILAGSLLLAGPARCQTPAADSPDTVRVPRAANPAEWQSTLRPYFFLSGVSGSVTAEPLTIPINSAFNELLDDVQIGAFITFTAEKGAWGIYTDIQYIRLLGQGTSSLDAALELKNFIAEIDATLRPPAAPTLRFLAGMRVYSIDETLIISDSVAVQANTTVFDPIVGAMGEWSLSDRWDFEMRVDIGGFGIGSEFTYQLLALFQADISNSVGIPFGYRVLGYQIKDGGVWMNTRMGGLVLGVDIKL